MLLRLQVVQVKDFFSSQSRQKFLIFLTRPYGIKTRELEVRTRGAKDILSGYDVHADGIKHGRGHKAGYKSSPDQVIQLELVGSEICPYDLGCQSDVGRANSFVCILRRCFGLGRTSLSNIRLSIFLCDVAFDFSLCFFRDAR